MAAVDYVLVGALTPECFRCVIGTGESGVDLSTVTTASIQVISRNTGLKATWAAVVEEATAEEVTVRHDFVSGETSAPDIKSVVATLNAAGVLVARAHCGDLKVRNP